MFVVGGVSAFKEGSTVVGGGGFIAYAVDDKEPEPGANVGFNATTLFPPEEMVGEYANYGFGTRVGVSTQGIVVICADVTDEVQPMGVYPDACFFYTRSLVPGTEPWVLSHIVNATYTAAQSGLSWLVGEGFGAALLVPDDDPIVIVGHIGAGSYSGAIYTYVRDGGGPGVWGYAKSAEKTGLFYEGPIPASGLGGSLAYHADDKLLAVGAPVTRILSVNNRGIVGLYYKTGSGMSTQWVYNTTILPPGGGIGFGGIVLQFGTTLTLAYAPDLEPYGLSLMSGMPNALQGRGTVATYFYNETSTEWVWESMLSLGQGTTGDFFGVALAASNDKVLIGAPGAQTFNGVAYLFRRLLPGPEYVYNDTVHGSGTGRGGEGEVPTGGGDLAADESVGPKLFTQGKPPYVNYEIIKEMNKPPGYYQEINPTVTADDVSTTPGFVGSSVTLRDDVGLAVVGAPLLQIDSDVLGGIMAFEATAEVDPSSSLADVDLGPRVAGDGADDWGITVATRSFSRVVRRLGGDRVILAVFGPFPGVPAANLAGAAVANALGMGRPVDEMPIGVQYVGFEEGVFNAPTGRYRVGSDSFNEEGFYVYSVLAGPEGTDVGNLTVVGAARAVVVEVVPGLLSGSDSLVWGESGLVPEASGLGVRDTFEIYMQARDAYGNNVTAPESLGLGPDLTMVGSGVLVDDWDVEEVMPDSGLFRISYVPRDPGTYTLTLTLDEQLVLSKQVSILARCRPGTFAQTSTGPCVVCDPGSYSDTVNAAACTSCPGFTTTTSINSTSIESCLCTSGFYSFQGPGTECTACFPLATCAGGTEAPVPQPGVYQVDAETFIVCEPEAACVGGAGSPCAPGYSGFGCGVCTVDYYRIDGKCVRCPSSPGWVFGGLLALVLVACLAFVGVSVVVARRTTKDGKSRHTVWSMASVGAGITYLQILSLLGGLNVQWPSSVSRVLLSFSLVNFNIELFAPECSVSSAYGSKYLFLAGIPLLLLGTMGLIFGVVNVVVWVARALGKGDAVWDSAQLSFFNRKTSVATVLTALPFMYISVTRSTLAHFNCVKREDGKWYLAGIPGERCFSSGWFDLLPVAILATLVYVVGIPALFSGILWVRRNRLDRASSLVRYGTLYRLYVDRLFFWELVQTGKKLLLVVFQLFFSTEILFQLVLLVALFSVSSLVQVSIRPFYRALHNQLEMALNISVWAVLFCGSLFYSERIPESGPGRDVVIALTLVIIFGSMCILFMTAMREVILMYSLYQAGGDPRAIPAFQRDDVDDALRAWLARGNRDSALNSVQDLEAFEHFVGARLGLLSSVGGGGGVVLDDVECFEEKGVFADEDVEDVEDVDVDVLEGGDESTSS